MIRTTLSCLSLFILLQGALYGQGNEDKEKGTFKERIFVGGDIIVNFGTYTALGASPLVGYRVSDRYSVGVGGTYIYSKFDNVKTDNYGVRLFNRYFMTDEFFAHAEFEYISFLQRAIRSDYEIKSSFPALPVGGGYRQSIGGKAFLNFVLLYDILQDPSSTYPDGPIIRGGVTTGF